MNSLLNKIDNKIHKITDRVFNGNLRKLNSLKAGDKIGKGSIKLCFPHSDCFILKFKTPLGSFKDLLVGYAPLSKESFLDTVSTYLEKNSNRYIINPKYHPARLFGIIPQKITCMFYCSREVY